MLLDTPLSLVYVNFQHVPQLGEFHALIAGIPPILFTELAFTLYGAPAEMDQN